MFWVFQTKNLFHLKLFLDNKVFLFPDEIFFKDVQ
jgi:hypothetical protein